MKAASLYAASTFEERGTAVPFTTPLLAQTRVRKGDRSHLEVLVPNLAASRGTYVIPWKSAPEVITMTVHDRTLHAEILSADGCSPDDIRTAALKVAGTGL